MGEAYHVMCRYMNQRPQRGKAYVPTHCEHVANIYTHGLLILPSAAALAWLIHLASSARHLWIALIYGAGLLFLFSVSTAFHIVCYSGCAGNLRFFCHIGDRAIIYVFIAASYTPWMILKEHTVGEEIVWVTWLAALLGVIYQYSFHERFKWLEILFYLVMGIFPSLVVFEMKDHDGIFEVAIGGAIYIIGVVFFKCDGVIPFAHAIWHCFVTAAAIFHYYAVIKYLYIPRYRNDQLVLSPN